MDLAESRSQRCKELNMGMKVAMIINVVNG
jgi:hypothetical protein